ncbi:MAG: hypothetical protein O9297_11375 [Flavobacterium sp.]|jgi:hypothetical protein|uniref:hypothetical protein n=2 Tax=Flavobacterium sp. TaxID=239 RepID=UPI0022CB265F|nr:hypothetical protein [Flavobacterium sp.]MCZ8297805.1 hypothetical protein [Flavobacterium sp.]
MNNYKLIYILFLFPICLFAQIKPTKYTLQKIVKNSVVEMKNGKLSLPSNKSWEFNNIDSLYFKKDTLNAFVYKKGTKHKSLCEVVDWTFYRKNALVFGQGSNCKEPPTRKVTRNPEDYYTITIYTVENETMIDVLRFDKMIVESFIVIEVSETEDYTEIKLVRRFNGN